MNKIRAGLEKAEREGTYVKPWDSFFWWWGDYGGPGVNETRGIAGAQYQMLLAKSDEELESLYARWLVEKGD